MYDIRVSFFNFFLRPVSSLIHCQCFWGFLKFIYLFISFFCLFVWVFLGQLDSWLHDDVCPHSAQAAGSEAGGLFQKVRCPTSYPPSVSPLPSVQLAKECSPTGTGSTHAFFCSAQTAVVDFTIWIVPFRSLNISTAAPRALKKPQYPRQNFSTRTRQRTAPHWLMSTCLTTWPANLKPKPCLIKPSTSTSKATCEGAATWSSSTPL